MDYSTIIEKAQETLKISEAKTPTSVPYDWHSLEEIRDLVGWPKEEVDIQTFTSLINGVLRIDISQHRKKVGNNPGVINLGLVPLKGYYPVTSPEFPSRVSLCGYCKKDLSKNQFTREELDLMETARRIKEEGRYCSLGCALMAGLDECRKETEEEEQPNPPLDTRELLFGSEEEEGE